MQIWESVIVMSVMVDVIAWCYATDEERAGLEEYTPRIQHRLASREIIDRKEYNRRYRPELVEESH